jgi:hypothetical protein
MKMIPDFNRIGFVVSSWQRGVVSAEEAQRLIDAVMDSANYIPASEMIPLPQADESLRAMLAVTERLEQKINLIIRHEGTRLPAALDPGVLSAEVKELAGKNQKIEAVALHRRNTAATLAETCELIQRHLERKQESH